MVNAEGEFVVAVPDKASWEQYQAKAQASAALEDVAATGSKELEERGIQCPLDKRMFVDPMKTPCCGKTYCNECIENALIHSDLVCPGCLTDGVLLDNLLPDEEMTSKIKAYEEEKKAPQVVATDKAKSPTPTAEGANTKADKTKSPSPAPSATSNPSSTKSKKRPAEEELANPRIPTGPAAMRNHAVAPATDQSFVEQMNALANSQQQPVTNMLPNMPFAQPGQMNPMMGGAGFPGMMNPMMGINPMNMPMNMMNPMMNPMMMQQFGMMNGGGGLPPFGMMGGNAGGGGMPGGIGFPQQQNWQQQGGMGIGWIGNGAQQQGRFPNQQQQQQHFGGQPGVGAGNEEENAYMRRPVNPYRHQGKQRKARPMDFREV